MFAYRIFRIGDDGNPETLFHGFPHFNGKRSRKVPLDVVINAERKTVHNPGKKTGAEFLSGWHVTATYDEAVSYLARFKDQSKLAVCLVGVWYARPKPRARGNVLLAQSMIVPSGAWRTALAARRLPEPPGQPNAPAPVSLPTPTFRSS